MIRKTIQSESAAAVVADRSDTPGQLRLSRRIESVVNTQDVARLRHLQRLLLLIELLAPLRHGATLGELASDVRNDLGTYTDRTIRRDLDLLELAGLVDHIPQVGRIPMSQTRWRWRHEFPRAAIFASAASNHVLGGR